MFRTTLLVALISALPQSALADECSRWFDPTFVRQAGMVYYVAPDYLPRIAGGLYDDFLPAVNPGHAQELCTKYGVRAFIDNQNCETRDWGDFTCGCDDAGINNPMCQHLYRYLDAIEDGYAHNRGSPARLYPSRLSAPISGSAIAAGNQLQHYHVTPIDLTAFGTGGVVTIEVRAGNSETQVSFDLYPEDVTVPHFGYPQDSVAFAYNVAPGGTATITYAFERGQVFNFCATGSWYDERGDRNGYTGEVTVTPNP